MLDKWIVKELKLLEYRRKNLVLFLKINKFHLSIVKITIKSAQSHWLLELKLKLIIV